MKKPTPHRIRELIDQAITLAGGTQRDLAGAIFMSQHAIYHARKVGRVSGELANKIHVFSKGGVSRETLRPDLFTSLPALPQVKP